MPHRSPPAAVAASGAPPATTAAWKRLSTLVQASDAICSTLDLQEVFDRILEFLTRELHAERSTLYLVDEATGELVSRIAQGYRGGEPIRLKPGQGVAGHVAASGEIVMVSDAYADPRFHATVDESSGFRTSSMLVLPLLGRDRTIGVLQVLNRKQGVFDGADEEYLRALGGLLALGIENARLHESEMERQRLALERTHLDKELRTARAIQERFLPLHPPRLAGLDVAGINVPSEHVSGDYYDFLPMTNNRLGIAVADVSGHGVPAALLMSVIRAGLHAHAESLIAPGAHLAILNELLHDSTDDERYATMFLAVLDVERRALRYANGGHNPPVLLRAGEVMHLTEGGMALGMIPGMKYEEGTAALQAGDLLALYTDGVTESRRPSPAPGELGEEYGEERLIAALRRHAALPAREIVGELLEELRRFCAGDRPEDDVTLVLFKFD